MGYLILYVLDNTSQLPTILDAWEQVGASTITILDSAGVQHLRHAAVREDLPLFPSLHSLFADENVHHKTLLSVVEDEAMIDLMVDATRQIVGDFSQPHTGVLCVLPLLRAYGLGKPNKFTKPG